MHGLKRLALAIVVASPLCVFAQQRTPSQAELDAKMQEQRGRAAQNVDEAFRRLSIPQAQISPSIPIPRPGSIDLDPAKIADMYAQTQGRSSSGAGAPQEMYLLVSMSMPIESLRRFAVQSARSGVPLVFRGFLHGIGPGRTEKSIEAMRPLGALGAQVSINPNLFRTHNIRQVPALLVMGGASSECATGECAATAVIVRGDASLHYLLEQVAPRNDVYGQSARSALARLKK